ncbi:hypothetical protein BH11BAC4_BH11BAC4_08480 [soil metagenome]
MLLTWEGIDQPAAVKSQYSDCIHIDGKRPVFEFEFFKPPNTKNWLFCLRQRLGLNEQVIETMAADGMQVISAGTFIEEDQAHFEERKMDKPVAQKKPNASEHVIRVKAKK